MGMRIGWMSEIEVGEDIRCYQNTNSTWMVDSRTLEHKIDNIQTRDEVIKIVDRIKKEGWGYG